MSQPPDRELLRRLEKAVGAMPRLQREIFMAHRLDDLSYGEIARRTGLSVHQVERQMARAICTIDKLLDGGKHRWWESWF